MQAYRLRVAEGHHTQVVKVCVEPQSKCAGFLLADSSCLLVSLSPSPTSLPTLVPAPCTDACFLSLQARMLGGGGSNLSARVLPIGKAASGPVLASGGKSRDQFAKLGEAGATVGDSFSVATSKGTSGGGQRSKGGRWVSNGNGKLITGLERNRVFFLTVQPGKGGSYVDLHAWLCEPPSFTRAKVGVDPGKRFKGSGSRSSDKHPQARQLGGWKAARLDVPHGMAVKMVASVNVVIVYSIAVGKIWVMAAKHVGGGGWPGIIDNGSISSKGNGSNVGESGKEFSRRVEIAEDGESPGHLVLMKCAVVDFNGPVYSLHVSLQHLLLGVSGGVWIWPLRPLIKPDKRRKDRERIKPITHTLDAHRLQTFPVPNGHDSSVMDATPIAEERVEVGNKGAGVFLVRSLAEASDSNVKNMHRGQEDLQTVSGRSECLGEPRTRLENGVHEIQAAGKEQERKRQLGVATSQAWPGNIIPLEDATVRAARTIDVKGKRFHVEANATTEHHWDAIGKDKGRKDDRARKHKDGLPLEFEESIDGVIGRTAAGTTDYITGMKGLLRLSSFNSVLDEDVDRIRKCAVKESLLEPVIEHKKNGVLLHNGSDFEGLSNVQESQSFISRPERVSTIEATSISEESHVLDEKGLLGPCFVPLCIKERHQDGFSAGKGVLQSQVVDIQEISLRSFVVLDSKGDMHLLALDDLQEHEANSDFRVSHPKMTPLGNLMKVTWMAVLIPAVQSASVEPSSVMARRLWISDGRYSNYVVSMAGNKSLEDSTDLSPADPGPTSIIPLIVSKSLFTSERVAALAAVSAETVLVVTQGSIIAYAVTAS